MVVAVLAVTVHSVVVVQSIDMIVLTIGLAVLPSKYDVESEMVQVQYGAAVLPVQDDVLANEVTENLAAEDAPDCDAELVGSSSSSSASCRSSPISTRVSVRASISSRSGTGTSTASSRLLTTCTAQLRSLAASPTRSLSPEIKLLLVTKLLNFFSEIGLLFLFLLEHWGGCCPCDSR